MKLFKELLLSSLLLSSSAFAATSGTLLLKGNVAEILSIDVQESANAQALDLIGGEADTLVADVVEKSNSTTGYTVTLSSANAGKLVNTGLASQTVDYTLNYGGQLVDLSAGNGTYTDNNPGTGQDINKELKINITGSNTLAAGDYTDTVTLSIAVN